MQSYSVTTVLSPFADFSRISPEVLRRAAERGTRVHAACAAHASGLWVRNLPEDEMGYLGSFGAWFGRYVRRMIFVEKELRNPALGFHGHPDLGVELIDGRTVVVDLKTPAVESPTWRAQLAAYRHLANQEFDGIFESTMALQLKKNGRPARAIPYKDQDSDFSAFLSALNAYRYFDKAA